MIIDTKRTRRSPSLVCWSSRPKTNSRHRAGELKFNDRRSSGPIERPKDRSFDGRMTGCRWDSSIAEGVHHQSERTTTASNHAWWAVRLGSIRIGWEWSSYEVAPEWRAVSVVDHRVVSITRYSRFWTRFSQPPSLPQLWSVTGEEHGVWATSTSIPRIRYWVAWPRYWSVSSACTRSTWSSMFSTICCTRTNTDCHTTSDPGCTRPFLASAA